jgi:hypothetical protein
MTLKSQTTIVCVPSKLSTLTIIDSTASWIGQQHNINCNVIYDSISAHASQFFSLNTQAKINTSIRYIVNYSYYVTPTLNINTATILVHSVASNLQAYLNSHNNNDSLYFLTMVDSLYQAGVFSVAGENCLLQLNSIITNNATSASNAISLINRLIQETENGFKNKSGITNSNELLMVLGTLYVKEYSISYWSNVNNQQKWQNILPRLLGGPLSNLINVAKIAQADITAYINAIAKGASPNAAAQASSWASTWERQVQQYCIRFFIS